MGELDTKELFDIPSDKIKSIQNYVPSSKDKRGTNSYEISSLMEHNDIIDLGVCKKKDSPNQNVNINDDKKKIIHTDDIDSNNKTNQNQNNNTIIDNTNQINYENDDIQSLKSRITTLANENAKLSSQLDINYIQYNSINETNITLNNIL